ncbi:MAG: sigma-54-dependent Fis family transcriptional regulator [Candidatus Marinimicrobia bacterium]|nr:sigma-54-dependent Fis family transcriptional regulator [Candidatus Neomarinimicrobiota bacterium]
MKDLRNKYKILVVEDNESLRQGLQIALSREKYTVSSAANGTIALEMMKKESYQLIISDIKMPGIDGLTLFQRTRHRDMDFILMTAFATVEIAVESLKQGVRDFITKPFPVDEIRKKVYNLFSQWQIKYNAITPALYFDKISGQSQKICEVKGIIEKVANINTPVLISGESGTGKELVARAIHEKSSHASGPFISVNCGALSAGILESELFGHEKGSFTGAVANHAGKFEQAEKGTLFLDEIGEMGLDLQVKLLRVLQEKQFQRVGGEKYIAPNFRLLAATNRDLKKEIMAGNFRADLYYRLNVVPIHVPPLRERRADIPVLVEQIVFEKSHKLLRSVPKIGQNTLEKLINYSWPGNIRELENFLERALIFLDGNILTADFLAMAEKEPLQHSMPQSNDLYQTLENLEREMIIHALKENNGIKQKTARSLNIKPSTLYYRMEKLNITEEDYS